MHNLGVIKGNHPGDEGSLRICMKYTGITAMVKLDCTEFILGYYRKYRL